MGVPAENYRHENQGWKQESDNNTVHRPMNAEISPSVSY